MLQLININKNYKDFALNNFSINIRKGDYYIILGESGAGKTIILEILAGLIIPDSGKILKDQIDLTNAPIRERNMGIVFQDYAVFPHMTVFKNLAYPLRNTKLSKSRIKEIVLNKAEETGISHLLHRKPDKLSGGELQRVALARTLVMEPEYLLLDEPTAALDIKLKSALKELLRNLNKQGQTIIHITHDYEEALALASRIAVVQNGNMLQEGSPDEIFKNPKSQFVANFTGIKNFFSAKIISENKLIADNSITIQTNLPPNASEGYVLIPGNTIIISPHKQLSSAVNNFEAVIKNIIPSPFGKEVILDAGLSLSVNITEESCQNLHLSENMKVYISFKASSVRFIPKE